MAVTNFHYITRMNSGFKVYILEGMFHFFTILVSAVGGKHLLETWDSWALKWVWNNL